MASLVIQRKQALRRLRVFVSYAHADAQLAERFVHWLRQLWGQLGLDWADVFYDAQRLIPGFAWEDRLLGDLRQSDLLVFLASADSLRADGYCMQHEVAGAAAAGVPILPVILESCLWQRQPIPGDPAQRTLGDLGVLPLGDDRAVKPVSDWRARDKAWYAVLTGLEATLRAVAAESPRSTTGAYTSGTTARAAVAGADAAGRSDLLPYLCDQDGVVNRFDDDLCAWETGALVVLVKGVYDDNPPRFWERLRVKHLCEYLAANPVRGAALDADLPLALPTGGDGAGTPPEVRRALLRELSVTLAQNRFVVKDVDSLVERLLARDGVITLLAIPGVDSPDALRGALEGLLALLDEIPRPDVLGRTVITVHLERPDLAARRLVDEWQLDRFARSHVVEVGPLSAVTPDHARAWHTVWKIHERFRVERETVAGVFGTDTDVRLRTFETRLRPLLGL